MPIYEYSCSTCGHKLEALQKVSEDPLKFCPECGEEALKKLVSSVGFRLKGTGWYETDFKDKKKSVGESASAEKKPTGTKTESKPASGAPSTSSGTSSE